MLPGFALLKSIQKYKLIFISYRNEKNWYTFCVGMCLGIQGKKVIFIKSLGKLTLLATAYSSCRLWPDAIQTMTASATPCGTPFSRAITPRLCKTTSHMNLFKMSLS